MLNNKERNNLLLGSLVAGVACIAYACNTLCGAVSIATTLVKHNNHGFVDAMVVTERLRACLNWLVPVLCGLTMLLAVLLRRTTSAAIARLTVVVIVLCVESVIAVVLMSAWWFTDVVEGVPLKSLVWWYVF